MYWANIVILVLTAYFTAGILFAMVFAFYAVHRVDPLTLRASTAFRLLILPGSALFWPLLLKRCLHPSAHPLIERNGHRLRLEVHQ